MPPFLPVRSVARKAPGLRVGKALNNTGGQLSSTVTTYIDIGDGNTRKELADHLSVGQIIVVGPLTASNLDTVVATGAVVDQGSSAADLILGVSAGELRTRSTDARVAVAATTTAVTLATADGTNPRWDLVVADATTGAVTKVDGTAAASPALPATPAGKVALAKVVVAAAATGIANAAITDIRPRG